MPASSKSIESAKMHADAEMLLQKLLHLTDSLSDSTFEGYGEQARCKSEEYLSALR
jgi:hypothetical protein